MFYLVLHLGGQNGQVLTVFDRNDDRVRAEFTTRADAEMARGLVLKFNSHSAFRSCCIESD